MSKKYFENPEFDSPGEERELIQVNQEDVWKIAKVPDVIETTGLGPCTGVIIYDPESKRAIVAHLVDPRSALDEYLIKFFKVFPTKKN